MQKVVTKSKFNINIDIKTRESLYHDDLLKDVL